MPKILIADDNPQNAELLEAHLEGTGFETRIAINGAEALELSRSWQPDVLLLDVMMPKLSGFEVCKQLRADPATQRIGIFMVTALDQTTDIDRALDAGTDDFMTRPVNKTELVLRVKALLASLSAANPTERALSYLSTVQLGV